MASTVGYSTLEIIPSVRGLRQQLERQTNSDFDAAGRTGGRRFGDSAGRAASSGFKAKFGSVLKDAFAPVAGLVAGAAIVDFFKDAVAGASDLAESANKIEQLFGNATGEVQAFAEQGAKALGQTKLSVLDAAASFGTFGKAAGLGGSELANFSTKLVSLSTDMASFFNTSPEQAIEAIGAALRGEAEPIRAYGVLLDDATLRQEALRQGLIQTTKQALTPQQKVLAAYQVILQQTATAQGDFERTSGGLANQGRILSAQWSEMKTKVGAELLPVVTRFVTVMNDDALPALAAAGGVAGDAAIAIGGLPTPVKAAAVAFVALRVAAATGLGTTVAAGIAAVGSSMVSLRLRTMLAADEFTRLRSASITAVGAGYQFNQGAGRIAASLGAIRVGATGAGAALKGAFSGALGIIGGPWGAAFIAGTAVLTKFWTEQQKTKARVEALTGSLNEQTGRITENTKATVAKALEDSGALAAAERLGLSLQDTIASTLGNEEATKRLTAAFAELRAEQDRDPSQKRAHDMGVFTSAVGEQTFALEDAIAADRRMREALGKIGDAQRDGATATDGATKAIRSYSDEIEDARTQLGKLLETEDKRHLALVQNKRDQLALLETLAAARKEAREGTRTLKENTEAGQANWHALLDLADQWNNSTPKVVNARGAYAKMRGQFIEVADSMGKTREQAEKLADRLLKVPKTAPVKFQSKGYQELLTQLNNIKKAAGETSSSLDFTPRGFGAGKFATGGLIGGRGSGTSDSNLIWASRGEFMQREAAVNYYGVEFMRKLNALQVPKVPGYAQGGLIGERAAPAGGGITVNIGKVMAQDYRDFLRQGQMATQQAALGWLG